MDVVYNTPEEIPTPDAAEPTAQPDAEEMDNLDPSEIQNPDAAEPTAQVDAEEMGNLDSSEIQNPDTAELTAQANAEEILNRNPAEYYIPYIGETVYFGRMEQIDDPDNKSKPVEWQVFNLINQRQMLLINKNVPDGLLSYGKEVIAGEKERTAALEWLNNEYIKVFSEEERGCLRGNPKINLLSRDQYEFYENSGRFARAGIDTEQWYLRPVIFLDIVEWNALLIKTTPTPTLAPKNTDTPVPPADTPVSSVTPTEKKGGGKSDGRSIIPFFLLLICAAIAAAGVAVYVIGNGSKSKNKRLKSDRGFDFSHVSSAFLPDSKTAVLSRTGAYFCAGCKGQGKRDYQEDNLWYSISSGSGSPVLAVLSDGMGGMDNGAESSAMTIAAFKSNAANIRTDRDIPSSLWQISNAANDAVYERNSEKGMNGGATLVCVYIADNMLYWISIGDSRIFLCRDGMLASVNEEHELESRMYGKMVDGELDLDDIRETQYRELRKLTSNIGRRSVPLIDQNFIPYRLQKGDKLLLCSDGISDTLSESELLNCLKDADPNVNCDRISQMVEAKNKKGQDNYSAIVIYIGTENGR